MVQWKMDSWKMFFFSKTGQTSTSSDWKGKKSRQSPNMRDDPYYFVGEEVALGVAPQIPNHVN